MCPLQCTFYKGGALNCINMMYDLAFFFVGIISICGNFGKTMF